MAENSEWRSEEALYHVIARGNQGQKIFRDDQVCLILKMDACQSGRSSSRVKPFFSSSLCARSSNCQKSFRWASNMLSRSVSSVTGKSTAQERPFFCNHDGFFRWQFLNDLAQLGLNCAQIFDLHNSNSFAPINNTLPFCARRAPR